MKNILFSLLFLLSFNNLAQECILPQVYGGQSTGSNMTLLFQENFIQSANLTASNPYMVAQTSSGLVIGSCYLASDSLNNGMQSMALWGDDVITDSLDGAIDGDIISLQIVDGVDVFLVNIESLLFMTNGLRLVSSGTFNYICSGDIYGCTSLSACNYIEDSTTDDGSCEYPEAFYDCFGFCVNDTDSDETCDELEVLGCMEPMACNYNIEATDSEECTFPDPALCETCSGEFNGTGLVIVNQLGTDGNCIYFGCTDSSAINFSPIYTQDDESCEYLSIQQKKINQLFIYPNPGKNQINILSDIDIRELEVKCQNIMGSVVFSKSYNDIFADKPLSIETHNIPLGMYLLSLNSFNDTQYLFWVKK